ncbi:DinB family protein [Dokdonia sp.]|uniref:DinB family protein n=1 Tax=Dokdonia sp. TaxID=2024995 RepID=UPI0032631926
MNTKIIDIISQFNCIHEGELWVGTNFMDKVSGITEGTAFIRPIPQIHSIAEIMAHLTIWNQDTAYKIRNKKGKVLDNSPENWRSNATLQEIGWSQLKTDYEQSILEIVVLLGSKSDTFLQETYNDIDFKKEQPFQFAIDGLLHHTVYHLGQIGITIKLLISKELHVPF